MLGLPKPTRINKPLSKKAVFDKFSPNAADRRLFDEQISRLAIVSEISPQTVGVAAGSGVSAVYVILVTLKTPDCHSKNIALLAKMIDQRMLFILQYGGSAQLAVYRAGRVLRSDRRPLDKWGLVLKGLDLDGIWENIIAGIGGIDLTCAKDLDESIAAKGRSEKIKKRIVALEKKAMSERQPRRKWELAEEVRILKRELEENPCG